MGAGQSQPTDRQPARGLHILRVTPASPASQTDLEAFFDFVVGLEGSPFSSDIDASELERIVESNENKQLNLLVWSSKTQQTRLVSVTPSRIWSSKDDNGASSSQPSLLGLSMRLCEPEFALDHVWHVLDVLEGSPAESAGLVPYGDWIVGWSGGALHAEGDFYEVVEAHVDKPLRVYVYSYDFDTLREVVLVPNRQWGGEGLLGCVFGFGLLHRIPVTDPNQNNDKLPSPHASLEEEYEEQRLFVPADAHADTVFDVQGANSPQWQPEHVSPSISGPGPVLTLNGTQVGMDDNALEVDYHEAARLPPVHVDQAGLDDEDGMGSLEDTTGSITSVD
ncbi:GRASP55/65 PDZ-like domain-containing protein [Gautieria morchelliformis]|nr:GRASP55/65 PDZ-like domain-containing protein [Gautieria morchelliformis]